MVSRLVLVELRISALELRIGGKTGRFSGMPLDVTAKVTTLRDFFITLFFVGLGMTIPIPNGSVIGLALLIALFTLASRLITTFVPLYLMKQGLRASLLPAINLAQISEFSLVVIQTGIAAGHIAKETASAASFAFVLLAVLSTFAIMRSDTLTRRAIALLHQRFTQDSLRGPIPVNPCLLPLPTVAIDAPPASVNLWETPTNEAPVQGDARCRFDPVAERDGAQCMR